jgi:hypothetical protein
MGLGTVMVVCIKNTVVSVILFIPAHSLMSEDILNGTEQVCVRDQCVTNTLNR